MLAKRGLKSRLVQKPGLLLDVTDGQKESTQQLVAQYPLTTAGLRSLS